MPRRLLRILALLVAIPLIIAFVIWRLSWMPPSWYRPAPASDAAAGRLGDLVEQRLIEEAHAIRAAAEPWGLRIREEQINAWLATRLPKWIAHEKNLDWPDTLGTPQVRLRPTGIEFAIPIGASASTGGRVAVVMFEPAMTDTMLSVKATGFALGRIGLWGSPLDRARDLAADSALAEMQVFETTVADLLGATATVEPVFQLADGRRVRLIDVQCGSGTLDLTFITEPPNR